MKNQALLPLLIIGSLYLLTGLTSVSSAGSHRFQVSKHIPYLESHPQNTGHTLDIYAPPSAKNCPVVVFIHGGAWKLGDKVLVDRKPGYLTDKNYLLVSINYRLHNDQTSVHNQAEDVVAAVNWIHENISRFGGNPDRLIIMGHSAGAHLAALAAINRNEQLPMAAIEGIILIDGACYHVPENMKINSKLVQGFFELIFTSSVQLQKSASPQLVIKSGLQLPPFLIIHAYSEFDSEHQAKSFTKDLQAAGFDAELFEAENENHNSVNMNIGWSRQPTTIAIDKFLNRITDP